MKDKRDERLRGPALLKTKRENIYFCITDIYIFMLLYIRGVCYAVNKGMCIVKILVSPRECLVLVLFHHHAVFGVVHALVD